MIELTVTRPTQGVNTTTKHATMGDFIYGIVQNYVEPGEMTIDDACRLIDCGQYRSDCDGLHLSWTCEQYAGQTARLTAKEYELL